MKNPYPKGSLNYDLWELGVALEALGEAVMDGWPFPTLRRFARWILRVR